MARFSPSGILVIVVLFNCSLGAFIQTHFPSLLPAQVAVPYTDPEAAMFAKRLVEIGFGEQRHQSGAIANIVLERVGIDKKHLLPLGRNVGDCTDVTLYRLSPHYQLYIDTNACFGLGLWVVKTE